MSCWKKRAKILNKVTNCQLLEGEDGIKILNCNNDVTSKGNKR